MLYILQSVSIVTPCGIDGGMPSQLLHILEWHTPIYQMRDPADAEPVWMQSGDPGTDTYIVDHATDTGGTKGRCLYSWTQTEH